MASVKTEQVKVTDALEEVFAAAVREAEDRRHASVDIEHLLWALLDDVRVIGVLELAGADVEQLEEEVDLVLSEAHESLGEGASTFVSRGVERLVARAVLTLEHSTPHDLDVLDVLGAFCRLDNGAHLELATKQGVLPVDVLNALCHGLARADVASKLAPAIMKGTEDSWVITLHNDDYTTQEFVMRLLMTVFDKPESEASEIMMTVHRTGRSPVGTFPASRAENRIATAARKAREEGFPLLLTAERAAPIYR